VLNAPGDVFQGDVITTDPHGQAQIRFVDDTRFVVGPNSRVEINDFVFKPDGTATDVTLNALKGTFRFISGRSPHEVYQLNTPTMTLGVRGTTINLRVLVNGFSYANWEQGSGEACVAPQGAGGPHIVCRSVSTGQTVGGPPGGGFADFRPGELRSLLDVLSTSLGPVGPDFGSNPPPGRSDTNEPESDNSPY